MGFLPIPTPGLLVNEDIHDAGQIEVTTDKAGKLIGIVSLDYSDSYRYGAAYGTGGRLSGFTQGIYDGGSGNISMWLSTWNKLYASLGATNETLRLQSTDMTITVSDLLFVDVNKVVIQGMKFTSTSAAYQMDSESPLQVDVSFVCVSIAHNGVVGASAGNAISLIKNLL